jgi:hypothetical protein
MVTAEVFAAKERKKHKEKLRLRALWILLRLPWLLSLVCHQSRVKAQE